MPTQILEGPRSDPSITGPTDPITVPPRTRIAPLPAAVAVPAPAPAPQPVRTRRRGRALSLLLFLALTGAATGGALAYYGVELPTDAKPRLPTARAAVGAIRGSGDYTTAPRYDTVEVRTSVPVEYDDEEYGEEGICGIIDLFCGGRRSYDYEDVYLSANGSIGATVAIGAVDRRDVTVRRNNIDVYVPGAELGEPWVDGSNIVFVDGYEADPADIDWGEVTTRAADKIESRAYGAGLRKEAQRAARRLIVHRLHSMGFRHISVYYS